jgi:hypothetical protein
LPLVVGRQEFDLHGQFHELSLAPVVKVFNVLKGEVSASSPV